MPVDAVTDIAPIVFPQALATPIVGETLSDAMPEVAADFTPVVPVVAEAVPAEPGLTADTTLVAPVVPEIEPDIEPVAAPAVAADSDRLPVTVAPAPEQTQETAEASLPKLADSVGKTETSPSDINIPDLDLAAALLAAQLAASDEMGEAVEAKALADDADLEALLKTLPPELAALLQATANAKPGGLKPVTDTTSNAATLSDGKSDDLLTLSPDKGADKGVTDPALSAIKDITATAEGADTAALPATVAASAQATQAAPTLAQTSQSDAQALMNNLSHRLNGATAASSASSAATAQAYVMSNQTADNIAALAAQIHKKMDGKTLRFDMELRPSDMGRVDVRMEINADGKLSAHLSFDSPVAETEFRGRQDDLRRQLEQSGFSLEDGSLSFSSRDQNPQQSGHDSGRDEREAPANANLASAQFSRHQDTADDMTLNGWVPGLDGFEGLGGTGRLALNVRV
ncbi:MAG: hypothetical protein B7Z26_06570 [Asticcacaulis sp. 32-58-5]|nr:MAG: hypothetical protein B7Z26_06570 [Asticcacaulis sp. 32-58-5]